MKENLEVIFLASLFFVSVFAIAPVSSVIIPPHEKSVIYLCCTFFGFEFRL